MQQDVTTITVLLGYPGDAAEAAEELAIYLEGQWNHTAGTLGHYRIEVKRWLDPYAVPTGYSDSGRQGAINESFLQAADIVIALFVNRLGSPWTDPSTSTVYESGTVAEVELGRAANKVVRIFAASSAYQQSDPADPGPPYAGPGEWRGPELRELRLQEKLNVWASDPDTTANGYYPLEWNSAAHLRDLVGRAISDDLNSRLGMPSLSDFMKACSVSVQHVTDMIGKYREELFVARRSADLDFVDFMASEEKPGLVLTGAAGMGKTNQLCHMAIERSREKPTLLLRGATIPTGAPTSTYGVWTDVRMLLLEGSLPQACKDRVRRTEAPDLPELLKTWLTAWKTELVICIDGINESPDVVALGDVLVKAAGAAAASRIRLFMSCRDVDWHLFESRLAGQLYNPPDTSAGASHRILMKPFTDEEYGQAWPKYKQLYKLKGSPDLDLERLCHDPLMLKFLGEAFKDKEIPSGASRDEIFDKYVENTFCDEKAHLWPLVMRLALRVYNERVATNAAEVAEVDAQEAVAGAQNLLMISSLDIVVGQVRTRSEQNSINFKYDAFFEYVLARALMNEWKWGRSIQHAADTVRGFIGDSRSYRFLPGTLLYLLRFLLNSRTEEGWDAAVAVLTDASKGYDPAGTRETPVAGAEQVRWKTFFCGFVMTDLETAQDFLDDLVELARDASSVVRWSAGLALGTMAVPEAGLDPTGTEMANKALEGLEADSEWQGRETAAGALRQFHRTLGAMAPRLERLADDINWRVRRQAGNTLGDLCLLNRGNAMTLLGQWSEADNWRLRRAVVQARAGLMADPALGMRVLEKMIIDPREEIRWRSVNVLANLVTSHREFVAPALVLFAQLAEKDPSVWVRRHVAYWLPDLHHVANTEQRAIVSGEIAEVVVNDAHEHVRWAAARAFGGFAEQEQAAAEAWLAVLENEHSDSDRIGYAVRYSRAQIALTRKPPRRPTTVRAVMEATEPASLAQARVEELARSLRAPQRPEMLNADLCKNDRYTNIQDAIKAALLNDDDTQFFDLLRHDEDEGLRWGAASALAKQKRIRGAQLDEAVLGFSTDYQYWVRRECLTALADLIKSEGTLPSQELVNQILTSATDPEAEVRDAALQCLVALQATVPNAAAGEGLPAALAAAVRELGSDPDRQVRQFAQGALTA